MKQIISNTKTGFKITDESGWPLFAALRRSEWTPKQWVVEDKNGRGIVCEGLVKNNVETNTPYPILSLPKGYQIRKWDA